MRKPSIADRSNLAANGGRSSLCPICGRPVKQTDVYEREDGRVWHTECRIQGSRHNEGLPELR